MVRMDARALISEIEERMSAPSARGLAHAVSRCIRDGALTPGTRLPPVRTVARELALSPTTVSSAWRLLLSSGAITTAGRRGTLVSDAAGRGAARYRRAVGVGTPFALDLSTGVPDPALLPTLDSAMAELTTAGTPMSYLDAPVLPELEEVLRDLWPYPAPQITVVDGALDGIDLITRSLLGFGDRVVVEHPCFPPIVDILEAAGMDIVGVPLDREGLSVAALRDVLDSGQVRAVFLQPRGQNPTGISMTDQRAAALAALLEGTGIWVVEDDSTADLGVTRGLSMGRHLPDQVVHVRSFSKSHGPDLRLAALSAPDDLMRDLTGRRQLGQGWTSRLLQRILLHLLTDAEPVEQVARARDTYARRRRALVEALEDRGVAVEGTEGLNLWLPVRDETAAVLRLSSQGVGVAPGQPFAVRPESQSFVRVSIGPCPRGSPPSTRSPTCSARPPRPAVGRRRAASAGAGIVTAHDDYVSPRGGTYHRRMTTRISHWINGQLTPGTSGRTYPVYNPATGQQTAEVDLASAAEVDARRLHRARRRPPGGAPHPSPSARRSCSPSASCCTPSWTRSPRS